MPEGGGERCWHSRCPSLKGETMCWICTTHWSETKPFSICGRKVTNCHMSLCCAYVKWAQPIAFAHSLCDLLSHTMSVLLSPVLMLCNLLCHSAAGSSPPHIAAYFATYTWPWYRRMLCNLLLCRVQALLSRLLQPVGPQRSRRAAGRDTLCSAAVLEHAAPVLWPELLSWKQ